MVTEASWQYEGLPNAAGWYPAIVRDDSALYPTGLFFDGAAWRRSPAIQPREGDYSRPPRSGPDPEAMSAGQVAAFSPAICSDKVTARETAEERLPRFLRSTGLKN